jgi:hypothetical protein
MQACGELLSSAERQEHPWIVWLGMTSVDDDFTRSKLLEVLPR